MPKFLERKLKQEYGEKSDIPYKIMNKMGVMRGNKITAQGRTIQRQHDMDRKRLSRAATTRLRSRAS